MIVKRIIQFFGIVWLSYSHTTFAAVSAYLNQTSIFEGDAVTLILKTDKATAQTPDLSALQQQFKILNSRNSTQVQRVNGKTSTQRQWTLTLQPLTKGAFVIPSIEIGGEQTQPIALQVKPLSAEAKAQVKKHVFIEASAGDVSRDIYVQQQIPYTVKLYYDKNMLSGNMSELRVENAIATQLGREKRYGIKRAGHDYQVLEKNFVISPEKSGRLHIPEITVSGAMAIGDTPQQMGNRRFIDDFFNDQFNRSRMPRKPFSISTQAIEVDVLPIPDSFTGATWLPAEKLVIQDSWQKLLPQFTVGEPAKRILTLQAKGLAGSQIPALVIPKPEGMKIYIEPIETDTTTDGKAVYGNQRLNITYIPNKAGRVIIPEIKVDYWDVNSKQQAHFTLPARKIQVEAGAVAASEENAANLTEAVAAPQDITEAKPAERAGSEVEKPVQTNVVRWFGLFLFLCAIAGAIYLRRRTALTEAPTIDISGMKTDLLQACDKNNKQAAEKQLLAYTAALWPDEKVYNLSQLSACLASGKGEIETLAQSLYAPNTKQWNGQALKVLIVKGLSRKNTAAQSDKKSLPPLYPI